MVKAGGGGRKQVDITGSTRCERVPRVHVPVCEELWRSDEPERDVYTYVSAVCDIAKRQIVNHFRNICCTGRLDLVKNRRTKLRWNVTFRFVYLHWSPYLCWLCLIKT